MRSRTRLLPLAAFAALVLGSLATPAAAGAATTWYVDDDGTAGATGCDGALAVPSSIQDAVDASGVGDTILVCPGTYVEQVDISGSGHKGLTVKSITPWTAVVSPKALDGAPSEDAIIHIEARNVRIQWLKVVARTTGTCENAEFGIQVEQVAGAVIRSNRVIASTKGNTRNPACGMTVGISAYDGSSGALIVNNLVRDFQVVGILAHDASDVTVSTNSVRYWPEVPSCASVACLTSKRSVSPALPTQTSGIRFYESTGRIVHNAVPANDGATGLPYVLDYGISAVDSDAILISRNSATQVAQGIVVDGVDGATIRRNRVRGLVVPVAGRLSGPALISYMGILLNSSTGNVVAGNRSQAFGGGISMDPGSTGNTITNNNALGNGTDCQDATGSSLPAGDPIDNTWTHNLGDIDIPVGLCTDATP